MSSVSPTIPTSNVPLPNSPSEKFVNVQNHISKQQALAWFLFIFGLIVQGVCTGFLIYFTYTITRDLHETEFHSATCPTPSKVIPVYVFIGLQVLLGVLFYFLAAWSFSKAHVFIK
jgi:hypothetical protein